MEIRFLFSAMVFMIFLGWILSMIAGTSFTLLNPIAILGLSIALIAVVSAGNTPIIKGGAMAVVAGILLGTFFIDFPLIASWWGLIVAPVYIVFLLALASLSK
jgi:hypothetical protein